MEAIDRNLIDIGRCKEVFHLFGCKIICNSFIGKIWIFEIERRNREEIVASINKYRFFLSKSIVFILVIVCGLQVVPCMWKRRTDKIRHDKYKEYGWKGEFISYIFTIGLFIFPIVGKRICWKSNDEKKSEIDQYTIPYDTKRCYHEKKCIYTHKYNDISESISDMVIMSKVVKKPHDTEINRDQKYISIGFYISWFWDEGKLSKEITEISSYAFRKEVEPHKYHHDDSSDDEAILFLSWYKEEETWNQGKK